MKRTLPLALCLAILLSITTISPAMAKKNYDFLWAYHNGIAQFEKSKKIGLMNEAGEIILPAEYDEINPCFQNGYTWVIKKGLYGLIDSQGNVIIEPQFTYIEQVSSGLVCAQEASSGLFGYVNLQGEWVIPPEYASATPFYGDIGIVFTTEDRAIMNTANPNLQLGAHHALVFNTEGKMVNDLGFICPIALWSLFNEKDPRPNDVTDYPNLARGDIFVKDFNQYDSNAFWGEDNLSGACFINEQGKLVDLSTLGIKSSTFLISLFSDGLLCVVSKEKVDTASNRPLVGFINRNGQYAIQPKFTLATDFYKGKAYVTTSSNPGQILLENPSFYFIDTHGNECGKNGELKDFVIEYNSDSEKLPLSSKDRFKAKNLYWFSWFAASEDVHIYLKAKENESGGYSTVDTPRFAYVNINTKEIIYENSFGEQQTDFGCGLYKVADSKGRIGFIDENGNLVSGLKKKGQ